MKRIGIIATIIAIMLLLITSVSANNAPTITSTAITSAIEDELYEYDVDATDADGDTLTFSLTEKPSGMVIDDVTGEITWTPDEEQIGKHAVTVKVTDDDATPLSVEQTFEVFVRPHRVCGDFDGESDISISTDIEDDDEDFYPGDEINIEVDVENEGSDEIDNIIVEAILYDTEAGKRIVTVESNDFNLDENDRRTVDLTVELPKDLDASNKLILFTYAYEDGNDDANCDWEYDSGLDFNRKDHDITINQVTITPETAKPGQTVEAKIDVENVGDNDEEKVYVKIKNSELGLDKKSEIFSIEEYQKDDDDEYTATVTFIVPAGTKSGKYDLEVYVYDKNRNAYDSGSAFITLTVQGVTTSVTPTTTGTATITVEEIQETVEPGEPYSIPVQVTNTATTAKEYKILLTNIADWAESTSVIDSYLTAGQTSTYYLTLIPKTDATEGQHSVTVNVKEGTTTITTKTLSFTIPEKTDSSVTGGTVIEVEDKGAFQNVFSGTTFWIIGDIVLVIVGIFFVRMLFSKKETE